MKNRVRMLGHALHPYLVPFPIGLLVTSVIFDILKYASHSLMFAVVAFWMLTAGILGALLAAIPGFIDFLALPSGTRAKTVGATHAIVNVSALLLFVASWAVRVSLVSVRTHPVELILSLVGVVLLFVGGWLGGELVERLGIGVHDDANVDAPSSLGRRRASREYPPTEPHPV